MDLRPSKRRCKQGYKLHPQVLPLHKLLGILQWGEGVVHLAFTTTVAPFLWSTDEWEGYDCFTPVWTCAWREKRSIKETFQFQNIHLLYSPYVSIDHSQLPYLQMADLEDAYFCCRCLAGIRPGRDSAPSSNILRAWRKTTETHSW